MNDLLFLGAEVLLTLLPLGVVILITKKFPRKAQSRTWFILFLFYLAGVCHVTGAGTLHDWMARKTLSPTLNLIPFSREIDSIGYALNLIMLIPFGFLVPKLWTKGQQLSSTLCDGGAFIVLIELSQLLNHRATDIDDVIMNLAGVLIGYALSRVKSVAPEDELLPLPLVKPFLSLS